MSPITRVRARTVTAAAVALILAGTVAGCSASPDTSSSGADAAGSSGSDAAASVTPTITSLSVTSGSISGGTAVTVTGTGLDKVAAVSFGGVPATSVLASGTESLSLVTPAATNYTVGDVDVSLTVGTGDAVVSGTKYSYAAVTPVDAQMAYLLTHWQNRNVAEYGSLDDNDCVNFASQSLIARGWTQTADWSHSINASGTHNYSKAWISSTSMMKYFAAHPELATVLTDEQRDQVVVGDIVQFDWDNSGDRDHTGVVTRIEGTGTDRVIYFAGHSLDSDFRSVDTAITVDHPGGTAYYWHLVA